MIRARLAAGLLTLSASASLLVAAPAQADVVSDCVDNRMARACAIMANRFHYDQERVMYLEAYVMRHRAAKVRVVKMQAQRRTSDGWRTFYVYNGSPWSTENKRVRYRRQCSVSQRGRYRVKATAAWRRKDGSVVTRRLVTPVLTKRQLCRD